MIRAVSLVPATVVLRRKKAARVRLWTALCSVAVTLGLAASGVVRMMAIDPDAASAEDVEEARLALIDLTRERETLAAEHNAATATLNAVRAASDHPDWSILLAFVSDISADRVVLTSFVLEPAPTAADGFDVAIAGTARSQQDVARFVLDLENAGVFASTRLNNAGSGGAGVVFTATCLIRPNGIAPAPAPGQTPGTEATP